MESGTIQSHIYFDKIIVKEIWDALDQLYLSSSEWRNMSLQEKLRSIKMQKHEDIYPFLTRIKEV